MWLSSNRLLHRPGRALLELLRQSMPFGHRVGADDLSGLEPLLEPAKIVGELRREILAADFRCERTDLPERGTLHPLDDDLRAAAAGSLCIPNDRIVLLHLLSELLVERLLDLVSRLADRDRLADEHPAPRLALLAGQVQALEDVRYRDAEHVRHRESGAEATSWVACCDDTEQG